MKRTYTKPEVCVVRYSTSDMFCQCSPDNTETVKQQLELFGWWTATASLRQLATV